MKVRLDISPAHLTVLTIPRSTDETHHRLRHRHHHRHHRRLHRKGDTPLKTPPPCTRGSRHHPAPISPIRPPPPRRRRLAVVLARPLSVSMRILL